jgi:hypothetical protein
MTTRRYPIPFIGGTFQANMAGLKGHSTFSARPSAEPAPANAEVICEFETPAGRKATRYRIK